MIEVNPLVAVPPSASSSAKLATLPLDVLRLSDEICTQSAWLAVLFKAGFVLADEILSCFALYSLPLEAVTMSPCM